MRSDNPITETLGSDPFTGNVIFLDKGVRPHDASPNIEKYFNLEIYNKGQEDERLLAWRERADVIDREIALCGCFVLITSEDMTAEEAINLYKSRDV